VNINRTVVAGAISTVLAVGLVGCGQVPKPPKPTASPSTPTPSSTSTSTPTPTPTLTPTGTPTSSPTGSSTPSGTPTSTPSVTPTTTPPVTSTGFYDFPNNQVDEWVQNNPNDGRMPAIRDGIANHPASLWVGGDWTSNGAAVKTMVEAAKAADKMPVVVLYNIPGRDCGGYSSGGAGSSAAYKTWATQVAGQIGNNPVTVIVEPDAIAQAVANGCQLDKTNLKHAVTELKKNPNAKVYLDAGNAYWPSNNTTLAAALTEAGVAQADGFALNTSNFNTNAESKTKGNAISALVGNKHYVIDTSRNGNGAAAGGAWCNPPGRAVGVPATTNTGSTLVDAYLWVKLAGESDGNCNGGPNAGQFSAALAYDLVD